MKIEHPSQLAKPECIAAIRGVVIDAETSGKLHPDHLAIIKNEQWFKILAPKAYGGLEMNLPEAVQLEECIAWINGSVGWVVTLCAGAGWFGGFIDPGKAVEIYSHSDVCLAGSGAPTGEAAITSNGYLVTGRWKYASGAYHATHFTANCRITQNDAPVLDDNGDQLILPFVFDKKDVDILPRWKSMGLAATGSETFEVIDLEVSASNCFAIDGEKAVIRSPLYLYPFLPLAEATTAVNLSGMALHFIDLCQDIFMQKEKESRYYAGRSAQIFDVLNQAKTDLDSVRGLFYQSLHESWHAVEKGISDDALFKAVGTTSLDLVKTSIALTGKMYAYCGLSAADRTSAINQVWRDIHTASQHALFAFNR